MKSAYIDSSLLIAIQFDESDTGNAEADIFQQYRLFSSNLLEAEVRATYWREKVPFLASAFDGIRWVIPRRALRTEFIEVLSTGYLRGAELWHVATALYLRRESTGLSFATLDVRQGKIADALGFKVIGKV